MDSRNISDKNLQFYFVVKEINFLFVLFLFLIFNFFVINNGFLRNLLCFFYFFCGNLLLSGWWRYILAYIFLKEELTFQERISWGKCLSDLKKKNAESQFSNVFVFLFYFLFFSLFKMKRWEKKLPFQIEVILPVKCIIWM